MSQKDFTAALLDPSLGTPEGLVDPQGRPAGKRFDVYRNNVTASLSSALAEGFPVIEKLLGDATFKQLAILYLRMYPPKSRRLADYGTELPDFLDDFEPLKSLPYLADVARLELALRRSYHAADATPINPEGLDPAAMMQMTPSAAPSTIMIPSSFPILSIWRFNMIPDAPKPQARPEAVMVARKEFDPEPHLLPPGGIALMKALDGKTPMGEALERVMKKHPRTDLGAILALFLGSGALVP